MINLLKKFKLYKIQLYFTIKKLWYIRINCLDLIYVVDQSEKIRKMLNQLVLRLRNLSFFRKKVVL